MIKPFKILKIFRRTRYFHAIFLAAFCILALDFVVSAQNQRHQAHAFSNQYAGPNLTLYHEDLFDTHNLVREVSASPDYLMNLNKGDVENVLSAPELTREELSISMWQYRNDFCVLDIYFETPADLEDVDERIEPVVYFEVRARQKSRTVELDQQACVQDIVFQHQNILSVDFARIYKADSASF